MLKQTLIITAKNSLHGKEGIRFDVLDGLRGVAAFMVLFHHIENGVTENRFLFENGFLAVDLFFMLSGFVIAFNYDKRLANGLYFRNFEAIRLIRLWPLAILGAVLGAIVEGIPENFLSLLFSLLKQLLFVPSFLTGNVYPLNGIQWTLFFELFINTVYALGAYKMGNKGLGVVIVASFAALVVSGFYYGTIGNGWGAQNFLGGFPRVFFGFFVGVALFRLVAAREIKVPPFIGIGAILVYLAVSIGASMFLKHTWKIDLLLCTFLFPGVVYTCALAKSGTIETLVMAFLGELSYPLYTLQGPIRKVMIGQFGVNDNTLETYVTTTLAISAVSYAAYVCFDKPTRKYLTNSFRPNMG